MRMPAALTETETVGSQPAVPPFRHRGAAEGAWAPPSMSGTAQPAVPAFGPQVEAEGATALVPRIAGTASQTVFPEKTQTKIKG